MELYFFDHFLLWKWGHFLLWKSTIFYYGNGRKWGVKIR